MAKYLVNTDYSFTYNDMQYSKLDENIVIESNFKPTNSVDIHKAIAKLNNISWSEWGKVHINYLDINKVTDIDIINLDEEEQTKTTELEGEYEVRIAWSFDTDDIKLPIDEFYDNASNSGNVCSLSNVSVLMKYPYATYRFALVSTNSTHIEEIPIGSCLKLYTGIITNNVYDDKTIIPRKYLREFLTFLANSGLLKDFYGTLYNIDDLTDQFENLPKY